ncbi:hypothetical protein HZC07_01615, partial [Candidatus Micrarchaeota archaeon]|nr:hypothetical protein [Candidatus Micrarchaeota archaeon]
MRVLPRSLFILFVLLLLSVPVFADNPCVQCQTLSSRPQARITSVMDSNNKIIDIIANYDNLSAVPSRQPINNSIILIEVSNSSGLQPILYKVYTDSQGRARFDFSTWSGACVDFTILYCPFCNPNSPACGFIECLNFSGIRTSYTAPNDPIPIGPGSYPVPSDLNTNLYLPQLDSSQSFCPPRAPFAASSTPALCLPLLIVFALLGGAMYLTGRNPFSVFNLGSPRVGRHIRYQPRGRGVALSGLSIAQAGISVADAAKSIKKGELLSTEGMRLNQNVPGGGLKFTLQSKTLPTLGALGKALSQTSGESGL